MATDAGNGVTYTVKELIAMLERSITDQMSAITARLDAIANTLEKKASDARVDSLEVEINRRLVELDTRLKAQELYSAGRTAVSTSMKWLVNACIALAASGIGTLIYYLIQGIQRGHS